MKSSRKSNSRPHLDDANDGYIRYGHGHCYCDHYSDSCYSFYSNRFNDIDIIFNFMRVTLLNYIRIQKKISEKRGLQRARPSRQIHKTKYTDHSQTMFLSYLICNLPHWLNAELLDQLTTDVKV